MAVTTVRLPSDTEQALEALSYKLDRSKGWIINKALSEYMQRQMLEESRWKETLEAMEAVARGDVVSGDVVHDWLSGWGTGDEKQVPIVAELNPESSGNTR